MGNPALSPAATGTAERRRLAKRVPSLALVVFSFSMFLSAALLFVVEPMIGKMLMPMLGGTSSGLEHLPGVFSGCFAGRVSLRSRGDQVPWTKDADSGPLVIVEFCRF